MEIFLARTIFIVEFYRRCLSLKQLSGSLDGLTVFIGLTSHLTPIGKENVLTIPLLWRLLYVQSLRERLIVNQFDSRLNLSFHQKLNR